MNRQDILILQKSSVSLRFDDDLAEKVVYAFDILGLEESTPIKPFISQVLDRAVTVVQKQKSPRPEDKAKIQELENLAKDQKAQIQSYQKLEKEQSGKIYSLESLSSGQEETILSLTSREKELQAQVKELQAQIQASHEQATEGNEELEELKQENRNLMEDSQDTREKLEEANSMIADLQEQLHEYDNKPEPTRNPNELRIILDPVTKELLSLTAERLTRKLKKEITPATIFTDMFLRYTAEQNAEWFFPFVIQKAEIRKINAKHKADAGS